MKELFAVDLKGMLRGLALSILGTALIICLFFIAYGMVFNLVTSKPDKIKSIASGSSLYADLPAVLYEQATKTPENIQTDILLKDPKVRQIALDVYNPGFVQSNAEKLIDGIYGWLEGNTEKPDISLDFKEKNQEFADRLSRYAKSQAVKSGEVTQAKADKVASGAKNLFLDNGLSPGIKTDDGKPIENSLSDLPHAFSMAKTLPYALIILALILVAIIYYASKDRIAGFRRISRLLAVAGIFILLTPVIMLTIGKALLGRDQQDRDQVKEMVLSLFESFMNEAGKIYYTMGILLILVALGLYIYARKQQTKGDKISIKKS